MTKADLIATIAGKTGIAKVDILVTLESFFKEVKEALVEGEPLHVRGFGSFMLKKRAAKTGRNIKEGTTVYIPEHFTPVFRPARDFMAQVRLTVTDQNDLPADEMGYNSAVV